ncbi:MAG: RsmD family RNA methyltransferase, partial [Eggerthellaceae bacterium]|nr:RsmD family RNA methyltransferase [Eggerthellaceae bacterium]
KNISTLGLEQKTKLFKSDIYTAQLPHTYDIVFLDPPYKTPQADIWNFIAHLFKQGALSPKAHIVYEHASQEDVAVPVSLNDICTIQKQRAFGEAAFSLLAMHPAQPH